MCDTTTPSFELFSPANAVVLVLAFALGGCGDSASTFISPAGVAKCTVTFEPPGSTVPAAGGAGAVSVRAARECDWTAQPDVPWLTISAGAAGRGDGTVQFGAAANPDPVARTGGIMLNGLRAAVNQAAAECQFELASTSASFSQTGGTGSVSVRASSSLCTWTAASEAAWISIVSGASGSGSASVTFDVAPMAGQDRAGVLRIAGLEFTVLQTDQCTYAVAPLTYSASAAGGAHTTTVTAGDGCPWTAASHVPWIVVATTAGAGTATVDFTVAATTGPSRTGTLTIAGQVVTVTQSPGCSIDVSPVSHTVEATGGTRSVAVGAAPGCNWTASSNVPWITVTSGSSGDGSGTVTFTVAATTGPSRSGTLVVGGQTVTVTQGQGCSYGISPELQNMPASGGTATVSVTASAGCAWTAASNAPWIAVTSGSSGSGNGTVGLNVAATTGPSRSGTLTIAGRTFTVNQGQGCSFSIAPASAAAPSSASTGAFDLRTADGCAWSAASNADWLAVTSGATGSGNGTVRYSITANPGPPRTGTITAGGQTFTLTQGEGCSFSLSPGSSTAPPSAHTGTFDVRTAAGCGWSAASGTDWLTITAGATGSGNGTVGYSAASNGGPQRTGTIVAGGQTFTLTQEAGCTYVVSPTALNIESGGGTTSASVTAPAGCAWTAGSHANWIGISSGASGSGNGTVQLVVAANSEAARQGTVTIAGQTVTIAQAGGCTFSIDPTGQSMPASGGAGSFSVSTAGTCPWTAAADAPWLSITSGASGTGPGSVQFAAEPNSAAARTGTITAAGHTFTVTQAPECSAVVTPETISARAADDEYWVDVSTPDGCSWTASSNAAWIAVSPASSTGSGRVELAVQQNPGPARSGSATIAGRTVTVQQESGCTFSVEPASVSVPVEGGEGRVTVTTSSGCAWTATSNAEWIKITSGASGSETGPVQFSVSANATPEERTGTISIGGELVTVRQAGPEGD
jgi:hypothetical protein